MNPLLIDKYLIATEVLRNANSVEQLTPFLVFANPTVRIEAIRQLSAYCHVAEGRIHELIDLTDTTTAIFVHYQSDTYTLNTYYPTNRDRDVMRYLQKRGPLTTPDRTFAECYAGGVIVHVQNNLHIPLRDQSYLDIRN